MTTITNAERLQKYKSRFSVTERLQQYKSRFSVIVEQIPAVASSINLVRKFKNVSPNFKRIA